MRTKLLFSAAVVVSGAALLFLPASCNNLDCGDNTIEVSGHCVASMEAPGADCGPGTSYDKISGRCVNDIIADGGGICGMGTVVTVDDAGNHYCVGSGGSDCSDPLPCPAPTGSNNISLCGRILDLQDSTPLDDNDPSDGEPFRQVELRVYDPIAFVSNSAAPILLKGFPDACGRFVLPNAPVPSDGFIAVATANFTITPGGTTPFGDIYVQTGIAIPASAGQVADGLHAWVFRHDTDTAWLTAAGLSGMTFGQQGVYIPIFLSGNALAPFANSPTAGVAIGEAVGGDSSGRMVNPSKDFYFDDTNPLMRTMPSATRGTTGPNGTGLYIMQPTLDKFSGTGAEPSGKCWPFNLAAAPDPAPAMPGGAFVQEKTATTGDAANPCTSS